MGHVNPNVLIKQVSSAEELLIIQDLDGVCIPLVKDPLTRKIDKEYVIAASKLSGEFQVLTNGEHGGYRGVNSVVDRAMGDSNKLKDFYLPGLAAGGIEYQDKFGRISTNGVTKEEIHFLSEVPKLIESQLKQKLTILLPFLSDEQIDLQVKCSILDTKFSPTINLNSIFDCISKDYSKQISAQVMINEIMLNILELANSRGLKDSFYLHVAPNLGKEGDHERIKFASRDDVGTTDIQFMLTGAIKEAGLLVLINKNIQAKRGYSPLGKNFNAREAPKNQQDLIDLCKKEIKREEMPLLIGVGDTVTSNLSDSGKEWLRGGSDRGFLTLIQELGRIYDKKNKIILVDSSGGEVIRPSFSNTNLKGISDPDDPLKFDTLIYEGPNAYISWFKELANIRSSRAINNKRLLS